MKIINKYEVQSEIKNWSSNALEEEITNNRTGWFNIAMNDML